MKTWRSPKFAMDAAPTRSDVQKAYMQWVDAASNAGNSGVGSQQQKYADTIYKKYKDLEAQWKASGAKDIAQDSSNEERKAMQEGHAAFTAGKPRSANPYRSNALQFAWFSGYDYAKQSNDFRNQ